jgi:hypothetical protein
MMKKRTGKQGDQTSLGKKQPNPIFVKISICITLTVGKRGLATLAWRIGRRTASGTAVPGSNPGSVFARFLETL